MTRTAHNRTRAIEGSALTTFLTAPEYAPHRAGLERLYQIHGFEPAPGRTVAEDFLTHALKGYGDESMPATERRAVLEHFLAPLGLDRQGVDGFERTLASMYVTDSIALRMADKDDADNFRGDGLPDRPEFARERENGGQSLRNQIEYSMQRAGLDPDRQQRRSIDSQRHLAVRDAVDRHTGSRPLDARLDNVDLLPHAHREAADFEARETERAGREPSVREALAAAFPNDDEE